MTPTEHFVAAVQQYFSRPGTKPVRGRWTTKDGGCCAVTAAFRVSAGDAQPPKDETKVVGEVAARYGVRRGWLWGLTQGWDGEPIAPWLYGRELEGYKVGQALALELVKEAKSEN